MTKLEKLYGNILELDKKIKEKKLELDAMENEKILLENKRTDRKARTRKLIKLGAILAKRVKEKYRGDILSMDEKYYEAIFDKLRI